MIFQSTAGFVTFAVFVWLMSESRRKVNLKIVCIGIIMQLTVGFVLLKLPIFRDFFLFLNRLVLALEESTVAGTSMVFGYLGGATLPFDEKFPGASFILAFRALPLILLMSALSALLVIVAFFQISDGTQAVGLGILRGITDMKIPTLITLAAYWLIGLPSGYFMAFKLDMGIYGVWYGLLISLTASAFLMMLRFNSKSKIY